MMNTPAVGATVDTASATVSNTFRLRPSGRWAVSAIGRARSADAMCSFLLPNSDKPRTVAWQGETCMDRRRSRDGGLCAGTSRADSLSATVELHCVLYTVLNT